MSLSGSLDDVTVADVLQFIHLGRSTGLLTVECSGKKAEIGFHEGGVVNASCSGALRFGELLVARGVISQRELEMTVELQQTLDSPSSLGSLFLASGAASLDQIRECLIAQVEEAVREVVSFQSGRFEFLKGEAPRIPDLESSGTSQLVPVIKLNTEMILLEMARAFDEDGERQRHADAEAGPAEGEPSDEGAVAGSAVTGSEGSVEPEAPSASSDVRARSPPRAAAPSSIEADQADPSLYSPTRVTDGPRTICIASPDVSLFDQLARTLQRGDVRCEHIALAELAARRTDSADSILVVDLRGVAAGGEWPNLAGHPPTVTVVAVIDDVAAASWAYETGADAAVPGELDAVAFCLRQLTSESPASELANDRGLDRSGFEKLRRMMADIRSGMSSRTVAVTLMHVVGECTQRAVLFIVRDEVLYAWGGFGVGAEGRPLAELTREMSFDVGESPAVAEAIGRRWVQKLPFHAAELPDRMKEALGGPPARAECVLLPVVGSERVIGLIYCDNGAEDSTITDTDLRVLDLAGGQVGVILENEILRRRFGSRPNTRIMSLRSSSGKLPKDTA